MKWFENKTKKRIRHELKRLWTEYKELDRQSKQLRAHSSKEIASLICRKADIMKLISHDENLIK